MKENPYEHNELSNYKEYIEAIKRVIKQNEGIKFAIEDYYGDLTEEEIDKLMQEIFGNNF